MGRAPCCDNSNVKRAPWSPEEDATQRSYVDRHGIGGNWIALPQNAGLRRCGKSCRLRWLNYLRLDIKHGGFTEEEDNIIYSLYQRIGSRWSVIASHLQVRTDNDVQNYWNTKLKKRLQLPPTPSNSVATPSPQALSTPTFKIEDFSLNVNPGFVMNQGMMLPMCPTPLSLVNYQQYDFTSNATTDQDSSAASSSVENWSGNINGSASDYDDALLSEFSGLEFYRELFPFYSSTVACKPERITHSYLRIAEG